ncbi:MAG: T9SS type A sorting domain-containing protein [Saprospiraceae bacterium]|nr:T9SS type A sorting domain-containing protein [Saprospiraceae bacterium]
MKRLLILLIFCIGIHDFLNSQCLINFVGGSYSLGQCGPYVIHGGLNTEQALYGSCGDYQFLPPNVGPTKTTSISQPTLNAISLYPNPTSHSITLDANRKVTSYSIYNAMGQRVIYSLNPGNPETINVSNLPPGFYGIRLVLDAKNIVLRQFIIQSN